MATITSTLTIAGTVVDRAASRVTLQRLLYGIQGVESLDFAQEVAGSLQGSFHEGQNVVLSMTDGTTTHTVFQGRIVSRTVGNLARSVVGIGYHALGYRYLANQIFTTAADGSGRIVYNLPHTDPAWSPNLSGLSVGTILSDYFSQHSSQLTALGIAQPPSSDLTPLNIVPIDPVVMTGRIFDMADGLLAQWGCGKYQCYIDPNTAQIRVVDTTALPATTLTFGTDPIEVPSINVDVTNCYTQTVLRGGGQITAAILSLSSSTLVGEATSGGGWTSAEQSSWTIDAYLYPSNSLEGTITSMSTQSVTADAFSGPVTSFAANYWSGAQIWVQYGVGSNYGGATGTYQTYETAEVTGNTAVSSGSATFNVDVPFLSTIYTSIEVHGPPTAESLVWRKYTIPNTVQRPSDGAQLNLHLSPYLMGSYPWAPNGDGLVVQATGPTACVFYGGQSVSLGFEVYPSPDGSTPGYIVFNEPTVMPFSSESSLKAGTPDGVPTDIKVLVPYSNGALSAQYPSSGYGGTAYTEFGWQQTLYRDYPNWVAKGQASNMGILAQNIAETVQNAVIDASVIYHGVPLGLMTLGQSLNLSGGLATGSQFASMNCPIRNITVEWPDGGGASQVTQFHINNHRKPFTGDTLFLHPLTRRPEGDTGVLRSGGPRFAGMGSPVLGDTGGAGEMAMDFGNVEKPLTRGQRRAKKAARMRRIAARNKLRENRERDRDYDLVQHVYEGGPSTEEVAADQKENDRRAQASRDRRRRERLASTMRPSDSAIVRAHEKAYGAHDPTQAIVDAHQSVYGKPDGEELASNE